MFSQNEQCLSLFRRRSQSGCGLHASPHPDGGESCCPEYPACSAVWRRGRLCAALSAVYAGLCARWVFTLRPRAFLLCLMLETSIFMFLCVFRSEAGVLLEPDTGWKETSVQYREVPLSGQRGRSETLQLSNRSSIFLAISVWGKKGTLHPKMKPSSYSKPGFFFLLNTKEGQDFNNMEKILWKSPTFFKISAFVFNWRKKCGFGTT